MALFEYLKKMTDDALLDYLPTTEKYSQIICESMKYSVLAGGKRIRPVLLLGTCSLCGGDYKEALPFACALEFIHTYSLIHDDHPSIDNDSLRRGKPTNHVVFGDDIAILAGDGLLNSAFDVMISKCLENTASNCMADRASVDTSSSKASGDATGALSCEIVDDRRTIFRRLMAMREISEAAGVHGMIAGQTADVINTGKSQRRTNEYIISDDMTMSEKEELLLYIHKNKTGAIIRAAVRAGAILGGASDDILAVLTEYAENIGLAFQISDDILDETADSKTLGKTAGKDKIMDKLTYPAIFGIEESRRRLDEATHRAVDAAKNASKMLQDKHEKNGRDDNSDFLVKMAIDLKNRIF